MKRHLGYILSMALLLSACGDDEEVSPEIPEIPDVPDTGIYLQGNGTGASPFLVTSLEELVAMRDAVNAPGRCIRPADGGDSVLASKANYLLTADINLASHYTGGVTGWVPIGYNEADALQSFSGVFDGGGHAISHLVISNDADCQGFFGRVTGGAIVSLNLTDASVKARSGAGIVAGQVENASIDSCTVEGRVEALADCAGMIAGRTGEAGKETSIMNCTAQEGSEVLAGGSYVGGIVGLLAPVDAEAVGRVYNCLNAGKVSGGTYAGGIAGSVGEYASVTNCCNTGDVTAAQDFAGGITSECRGDTTMTGHSSLYNCVNTGRVSVGSGAGTHVGAVCGSLWTTIGQCYWLDDGGSVNTAVGEREGVTVCVFGLDADGMANYPTGRILYSGSTKRSYDSVINALNACAAEHSPGTDAFYCGWKENKDENDFPVLTHDRAESPAGDTGSFDPNFNTWGD